MSKKLVGFKELVTKMMKDSFNQRSGNKEYRTNIAINLVSKCRGLKAKEISILYDYAVDYASNFKRGI